MKKETIIALVDLIVSKRINEISLKRGPRGIKGQKGSDGKDFSFEENKESIKNLILPEVEKIKADLVKFSNEEIARMTGDIYSKAESSQRQGPRGLRGPKGESFVFENHKEEIELIIKNHIDGIDFNLDSTIERIIDQKDIKLRITDLSDEDRELLKGERGPRGLRGQRGKPGVDGRDGKDGVDGKDGRDGINGKRGLRGPKGIQGERGEQGIQGEKGPRGQRGKKGEKGEKGDTGLRGPRGIKGSRGETGPRGEKGRDGIDGINGDRGPRGFTGQPGRDGADGKDAPYIIDVELLKEKDYISFAFHFSDGGKIITNRTEVKPGQKNVIQQMLGGGGTSVRLYENDDLIGNIRGIRATTHLKAVYEEDTGIVEFYPSSSVGDDGVEISDSVEYFNFTGNGVTVVENDAIYNWPNLDELESMDQQFENPKSVNIVIEKDLEANSGIVSGVLKGGEVVENPLDNTKFDIEAGAGYIVDFKDKDNPTRKYIQWSKIEGIAIPNLESLFTSVMLDENGTPVLYSGVLPGPRERRDYIVLQVVTHANQLNITNISRNRQIAFENQQAILDYIDKIGPINSGNSFYPFSNNLQIGKEAGITTMPFFNALVEGQDPTNLPNPAMAPVTSISRYYQDGAGGTNIVANQTVIDPTKWDNNGTLETVSNNKWTVQRVYFYGQLQAVAIPYGQAVYDDENEARASIFLEDPVLPSFISEATFVTAIILKGNCTNLSDESQAIFVDNVQALVSRGGRAPVQSVNGMIGDVDVTQKGGNYGKASDQSIPDGSDEVLIFDETVFEDGNVLKDATHSLFTLQESGKFSIDAEIEMEIIADNDDVTGGILRLWRVDAGGDVLVRETRLGISLGVRASDGAIIVFSLRHKAYLNNGQTFYITFNKSSLTTNTTTMVAGGTYLDIAKL